jgi:hypothetical protein
MYSASAVLEEIGLNGKLNNKKKDSPIHATGGSVKKPQ